MTFVILTGGIDLSVGSILALAGAIAAGLLKANVALPLVIVAAIGIGALLKLANGFIVTAGRITPFVTTLGMMSIARSLTLIYCNGYPISGFKPAFRFLGGGDIWGMPFPIVVFLVMVVLAAVILGETRLGRYTYAIGGNEETVRLSGIRSSAYKTAVYVISGVTAGVSALVSPPAQLGGAGGGGGVRARRHRRGGHRGHEPQRRARDGVGHARGGAPHRGHQQRHDPARYLAIFPAAGEGAHHHRGGAARSPA